MRAVIKQLATCMRYIFVRSSRLHDKRLVDFWLPGLFALMSCVIVTWWPRLLPLLGEHGLLNRINGLVQVLVGFFVASLAAVATFPNASMEQDTKNLTLKSKPISRRVFLASIFGYLSLLGFSIYLMGVFSDAFFGFSSSHHFQLGRAAVRSLLSLVYFFFFWQMFFIMFLGIHYLVDRIHRVD